MCYGDLSFFVQVCFEIRENFYHLVQNLVKTFSEAVVASNVPVSPLGIWGKITLSKIYIALI